jgi:hypothetical protein
MGRKAEALDRIAMALERIAAALERTAGASAEGATPPAAWPQVAVEAVSSTPSPTPGPTPAPELVPRDDLQASTAPPAGDRTAQLPAWLAQRGVTIQREKGPAMVEEALLPIASLIGGQYDRVKLVVDALKRGNGEGTPQTVNLKDQPAVVVTSSVHLAHQLHQLALIEAFKYYRAPAFQLHLTASRLPVAINFITGGWLELYVRTVLLKALNEARPNAPFSLLENPQVTLPAGEDFELDLLLEVGGDVWWIEMKTGGFQRHIAKYNRVSRLLRLPPSRCFMVLCEADAAVCSKLSSLFAMTVVPVADAKATFAESLRSTA